MARTDNSEQDVVGDPLSQSPPVGRLLGLNWHNHVLQLGVAD